MENSITETTQHNQLTLIEKPEAINGLREEAELNSDESNQLMARTKMTREVETLTTNVCNSSCRGSRENDGIDEVGGNDPDDDENEDDDDGWITPDNISRVKDEMRKGTLDAVPANVTVGCLTTDFAMQVIKSFLNWYS